MEKNLMITNDHPDCKPTEKMVVELEGGSPWFGYIWIDGILYTITKGERTVKIRRTNP